MNRQYWIKDEKTSKIVEKTLLEIMLDDEPCCIYHESDDMDEIAINFGDINGERFIADLKGRKGYHILLGKERPKEIYESRSPYHSEVDKLRLHPRYITNAGFEQIMKEFKDIGYELADSEGPIIRVV